MPTCASTKEQYVSRRATSTAAPARHYERGGGTPGDRVRLRPIGTSVTAAAGFTSATREGDDAGPGRRQPSRGAAKRSRTILPRAREPCASFDPVRPRSLTYHEVGTQGDDQRHRRRYFVTQDAGVREPHRSRVLADSGRADAPGAPHRIAAVALGRATRTRFGVMAAAPRHALRGEACLISLRIPRSDNAAV